MIGPGLIDRFNPPRVSIAARLLQVNWGLVLVVCAIAAAGFAMLYSAADGSMTPWAYRQMLRFAVGLAILLVLALVDIRHYLRAAYPFYGLALLLLVATEMTGEVGMGARRWIDFGVVQLQPSEVMKLALVLALARYFHGLRPDQVARPLLLLAPLGLVAAPALLVLRQPDLGTAGMLVLASGAIFFAAGVRLWKFAAVILATAALVPLAWQFLRDYQKNRILTFLDPESDPLGTGYHILQSKIALGSGGVFGKGFLQGSQSHLNFLPEKQTDFVFTMLAEEFGMIGAVGLIGLYLLVLGYGIAIALRSRSQFGRLLATGVTTTFFLYMFINIAMVMGLVPVVGVPLPLMSYGGTALLTAMIGLGLLIAVHVHRDVPIGRQGGEPG